MRFEEIAEDVRRADESRVAVIKAIAAPVVEGTRASAGGGEEESFAAAGALEPPFDPLALCALFEHSNALRQNVDAYATNIDGFGHRFEPALDLSAEDVDARIAECIALERLGTNNDAATIAEATDAEIAERKREVTRSARLERARLETFFEQCAIGRSFVDLRRCTRQDLEVTGNAYWEVLRAGDATIARLVYVPSHSMRLLPIDAEPTVIEEPVRVSPIALGQTKVTRRLRRYVQLSGAARVYFKELGDPRVVSRDTGKVFASIEALRAERPLDAAATEMIHFALHSPRSPYGVPRWIGTILSVLGSREMEEVNHAYFQNKSVPPLALLVSGGKLADGMAGRIERFIDENLKGKRNFHRVLIVEAESHGTGSNGEPRARLELKPLTEAQQKDALFSEYDERNIDKVGSAFRLPRLLRGDSREVNRSTSESALRFAEDQVFAPERDEFDYLVNRRLLAAMGIRFWRFRSQTPVTRDPERMSEMVEKLVRVGVLTPEEGRVLAGDIFNREFARLDADWTKRPITLTLAGIQTGQESVRSRPGGATPGSAFEQPARVAAPEQTPPEGEGDPMDELESA